MSRGLALNAADHETIVALYNQGFGSTLIARKMNRSESCIKKAVTAYRKSKNITDRNYCNNLLHVSSADIVKRIAEVQARWTEKEFARRAGYVKEPYVPKMYTVQLDSKVGARTL